MSLQKSSLELSTASSFDDDGRPRRTGSLWSCVAHIITAVIGSGVLSLAWSTAQLGWIAGPITLLCFAIITYISAFLLSNCYRSPDPIKGVRNYSYMDAVKVNLGRRQMYACGALQYLSMYGTAIAYVITTATSMRAILKSNCYHQKGKSSSCHYGGSIHMLVFGVVQIVISQIPNVHDMVWLSVVAAIMSFCYSSIGLGLGLATVIENGGIQGRIEGVSASSDSQKVWTVFEAIGDIAFAYPYSLILLEIQDTLRSPPPENQTMKNASMISIFITTFFYFCCGCFGYAAFGDKTPGNLLTGFGFYEPFWLIDLANACIIIHLVGGYQMYSQPIFAAFERWFSYKYPNNSILHKFYTVKIPLVMSFRLSPLRLAFRTIYVVTTTGIAMSFPYFNSVIGLLGALNFWPLAIYFPVEMYFVQTRIQPWTNKWIILRTFSVFCFMLTVVGFVGSFESLISSKFG